MPGGAVVGRAEIMGQFDFTGDPSHDRFGRVAHLGTFNANPLSAAAGIATLRLVADGQPQARADAVAALLRQGMEDVLARAEVAGYAYGDSSLFHVYLESHPGSRARSRAELHTSDAATLKGIPGPLVTAFQRNLQIRGVDLMSYTGGAASAAHTEADVERTLDAFGETIRVLLEERIVARTG